jgi:clan AA aspartic protease
VMTGQVTADREAVVRLTVRGPGGIEREVDAVLDTGFTEYLSLPSSLIAALALPYQYAMPFVLADGSPVRVAVYDGAVVWDGQERVIPVHRTDSDALIGMSLLYGSRLLLDAVGGGPVTITPLP